MKIQTKRMELLMDKNHKKVNDILLLLFHFYDAYLYYNYFLFILIILWFLINYSKINVIQTEVLQLDDSIELPVKKSKTIRHSDDNALQLWYRAIQATDKSVIVDSTYWLIQGGYTEEDKKTLGVDGWKHLCNNFSQQWRLYKKKPDPWRTKATMGAGLY